jgi:hypothetical protein
MPRRQRTKRPRIHFGNKDKMIIARYRGQEDFIGRITCKECGRSFPMDIMQVDHIFPVAKGGKDQPSNLRLLCPTCNRKKGSKRPTMSKPEPLIDGGINIQKGASQMAKKKGPKTANGMWRKTMTGDGRKDPEKAAFRGVYEQLYGKKKKKS